jgi:hypothetical protein
MAGFQIAHEIGGLGRMDLDKRFIFPGLVELFRITVVQLHG